MLLLWMRAWDNGKLRRLSSSLTLFLLYGTAPSVGSINIDWDSESEKQVFSREEGPFLRAKVSRTAEIGHLRGEGGPHLHKLVAGERSREAKLSLAVEV